MPRHVPQVRAQDYVVVVQRVHEDFCVKIVQVNETGKVRRGGREGVCVLGGGEMGGAMQSVHEDSQGAIREQDCAGQRDRQGVQGW